MGPWMLQSPVTGVPPRTHRMAASKEALGLAGIMEAEVAGMPTQVATVATAGRALQVPLGVLH